MLAANVVSLLLEPARGHYIVTGTLQSQPARFVVDTGASEVLITPALARRAGVVLEREPLEIEGVGGVARGQSGVVSRLQIGGLRLENVPVVVVPLPESLGCDALLGFPLFEQLAVRLDFSTRSLLLGKPGKLPPLRGETALELRFEYHPRIPSIPALFEGAAGWLSVDTGSDETLSLEPRFMQEKRLADRARPSQETFVAGIGGMVKGRCVRASLLVLGTPDQGILLEKPLVVLSRGEDSAQRAGNLGTGILQRFVCTFDYQKKRLSLAKNALFDSPFPHNRAGFETFGFGGRLLVRTVAQGSPAAEKGIEVGDELLAVDSLLLTPRNSERLHERVRQDAAGTTLRLALRSKGSGDFREVLLTLRDLL